ncbi:hypothetical protein [Fibrella aquatica]|uniref:hypothetical protein n=1 Tax=Fibrella aquatica TaxID=3242487 RepID=UPI00352146F1
MADSSQFATALINETVHTFSGGAESVSAIDGISLINNWISALQSEDSPASPVAKTLSELQLQLQESTPDTEQVQRLLSELADQTREAAQSVEGGEQTSLTGLADALAGFGERLAGHRSGDGSAGATVAPSVGASTGNSNDDSIGASGAAHQDGGPYNSGYGK